MTNQPIIKIDITRLYHQDKTLVKDIKLEVETTDRILITGVTGSGKTSLMHTLNLMNPSYEGTILFLGKDVRDCKAEHLRTHIMEVMQEPWLDDMPVKDVLLEPYSYSVHKGSKQDASEKWQANIEHYLKSFGLSNDILAMRSSKLSGGEKQRIALIRTLQFKPKVLLLDEISSALDQKTSALISDCLFNSYEGAIIAVSHDPLWQSRWNKVWHLEEGHINVQNTSPGGR